MSDSTITKRKDGRANRRLDYLIFLNGDNNLEPYALQDFREMARVGSSDRVNIVVQFDRNGAFASTIPQWRQCLRFKVARNMRPIPANALQDLGEVNMGSGDVLADFVQWGMREFPAHHYMLDIWNHGQGWRVFEAMPVEGSEPEVAAHREFRREVIARDVRIRSARRGERHVADDSEVTVADESLPALCSQLLTVRSSRSKAATIACTGQP